MAISSNDGRNYRGKLRQYDWDWTPLNDAFDRGIRLTDIDGMVEVGGNFLFIEGKSWRGLPKGQRLALERLAAEPNKTVIVLEGTPPNVVSGWRVIGKQYHEGTYAEFVGFIRLWFEYANKM